MACLLAATLSAQHPFRTLSLTGPDGAIAGEHVNATLDFPALRRQLLAKSGRLTLPLPDGTEAAFSVEEAPVFDPELSARYPDIRSYRLEGEWGAGRLALSPTGADVLLAGPEGLYAIQRADADAHYQVFYSAAYAGGELSLPLSCGFNPADPHNQQEGERGAGKKAFGKSVAVPRELRQYDIVLSNTGEFANQVGGTKEKVLAAFNTAISTVNVIFEREVGVRLNLLAISEEVIFLDPANDPYADSDEGTGLLEQVAEAFRAADIPADSYDLGHVMTSRCIDVGGVVSGLACSGSKTRGVT